MRVYRLPGSSAAQGSACNGGDWGLILGLGRSPGEGLQYSFLPGESPRTEEPGGLQSMGWPRVRYD